MAKSSSCFATADGRFIVNFSVFSLSHSRFTGFTATPRGRGRSFVLLNRTDTHITRVRLKIGGGGSTCSFLIRVYINADEWASGIKFGTKMRPFVEGERNDDANAFRFDGTSSIRTSLFLPFFAVIE